MARSFIIVLLTLAACSSAPESEGEPPLPDAASTAPDAVRAEVSDGESAPEPDAAIEPEADASLEPDAPSESEVTSESDAAPEPEADAAPEPDIVPETDLGPETDAGPEPTSNAEAPSPFAATGFAGASEAQGLTLRPLSMTTTGSSSTPDGALILEALP